MPKILGKIKNLFCGKFVCRHKKKPAQPAGGEEPKPQQEEPKTEDR